MEDGRFRVEEEQLGEAQGAGRGPEAHPLRQARPRAQAQLALHLRSAQPAEAGHREGDIPQVL